MGKRKGQLSPREADRAILDLVNLAYLFTVAWAAGKYAEMLKERRRALWIAKGPPYTGHA